MLAVRRAAWVVGRHERHVHRRGALGPRVEAARDGDRCQGHHRRDRKNHWQFHSPTAVAHVPSSRRCPVRPTLARDNPHVGLERACGRTPRTPVCVSSAPLRAAGCQSLQQDLDRRVATPFAVLTHLDVEVANSESETGLADVLAHLLHLARHRPDRSTPAPHRDAADLRPGQHPGAECHASREPGRRGRPHECRSSRLACGCADRVAGLLNSRSNGVADPGDGPGQPVGRLA